MFTRKRMISYLYSIIINLDYIFFFRLSMTSLPLLTLFSSNSFFSRVLAYYILKSLESHVVRVYQYFHTHFWLVCFFFLFMLLLFLFCFGFTLELEMCFFCLVLFFGTFRFIKFFFQYIFRRNWSFFTKLLIRLWFSLLVNNRLIRA